MASGKTQNNHYVSQFILRGFSSNKDKNKIWRYDLETGDIREDAIVSVAYIRKGWSQEIENFFGHEFEAKAADIFYRIQDSINYFEKHKEINEGLQLTKKDVQDVIEFLVMQFVRSIAISKYIEKSMNKFIDTDFFLQEIANQICSRVELLIPGFIQDKVSYLSHRDLRVAFLNPIWLKEFTEEIREYLIKKQMNVFWIPKHRGLITSDFPIAFPNQKYGVAYPDSEWWFPLTKNIVIAFGELPNIDKIQYAYSPITPKQLDSLNRGIVCQATRYIFGHNKELVLKYGKIYKRIRQSFVFNNL